MLCYSFPIELLGEEKQRHRTAASEADTAKRRLLLLLRLHVTPPPLDNGGQGGPNVTGVSKYFRPGAQSIRPGAQ